VREVLIGLVLLLCLAVPARAEPCCGPITPDGVKLRAFLDNSDVLNRWLSGEHIIWDTGEQDPSRPTGPNAATHCSAFAAAMAMRLGIYVLRPPDHSQALLANAQMGWLRDHGAEQGWQPLASPVEAQEAANRGELVLEAFENPNPHRPGHIAIVRPSLKSRALLDAHGPQETQAGGHNSLSITTMNGFRSHPGAWLPAGDGAIHYYAHEVSWP
jgi:hypothetical protein